MKNIVLIGMMGCGKSTCGALLAQRLGCVLVDTDARIAAWEGCSISEIFAVRGEAYFRAREQLLSEELAQSEDLVIACGGGLPLRERCIRVLKQSGTVVFLNRDPGEIYDSVSMEDRPLGRGGRAQFMARFAEREPIYRRWADLTVKDFSSPEATLNAILEGLS